MANLRVKLLADAREWLAVLESRPAPSPYAAWAPDQGRYVAALAAGRPVQIETWKLAGALFDLGDLAGAAQVEHSGAALFRVERDGAYAPA